MTESPSVKAEGPEPPDEEVLLKEKHRETMAKLDAAILDQLKKQPIVNIPENTAKISVEDRGIMYTSDPRSIYSKQQMQPERAEIERIRADIERVRADMYRTEGELVSTRNKLAQATDELNRVSDSLLLAETMLSDAYELIGQLVSYLDSIEWGTHDEWTRSQSLRERAHEYVKSFNTIAY